MTTVSSTFERLHTDLAKSLVACRAHPDGNAVHSLRTTTRRTEALLRTVLHDHPQAATLHDKIERALDELKKVRKAAGPVRDLDVQSRLLVEIVETSRAVESDVESMAQREELDGECERLDHSLKRRRKQSAATLTRVLKDAEVELKRSLDSLPDAMANLQMTSPLKTARSLMLDSSLDLNDVSGESLHSYRKRAKAARYLAEMQTTSPRAQRLAKRLKQVLDDIGRWHDLMLLTQETKAILGKRSILTRAITAERDRALSIAIHSATTINSSEARMRSLRA